MCGIVGIVGKDDAASRILDSLRKLEYRGYDSAGIAVLGGGKRDTRRAVGKLAALANKLDIEPLKGDIGIGHTRWATHGAPTEDNAHPHNVGIVSVVHNGIIENFQELREELIAKGASFKSDTDTETVAQLIHDYLQTHPDPVKAVELTLGRLEGAFSLGIIFDGHDDLLICARRGSPLAIGYGNGENYIGSDAIALAGFTDRICYLNDGDWAVLTRDDVTIYDALGNLANRPIKIIHIDQMMVDKGNHRHFMAKEIHDQPTVLAYAISHYLNGDRTGFEFSGAKELKFDTVDHLHIVACGTAAYAGEVAKYWFESWARIPTTVEIASEFRYREPPLGKNDLAIFISQSGETADTLAALDYVKSQNVRTLALVNVDESTMAREADLTLPIKAGAELSVASTKAFTCQLTALAALAMMAARANDKLDDETLHDFIEGYTSIPRLFAEGLDHLQAYQDASKFLAEFPNALFLGRGHLSPIAFEGALKLKEISYIHAEAYASGELKHGPIALVDPHMPIIVFAPHDRLFEKSISNIQEVLARSGRVVLFTDADGAKLAPEGLEAVYVLPKIHDAFAPIFYALPAQLLAYYTAVEKGTDVDQPRNLAKSVTVE